MHSRALHLCHGGHEVRSVAHASCKPGALLHRVPSHKPCVQLAFMLHRRTSTRHSPRTSTCTRCQASPVAAESQLQNFLGWAIANGVQGVGTPGAKAAAFEGEHGERGLACVQDIERGEVILRVPLRLAVTEHPSDEESNTLVYPGAPWSVRLAAKLLRMRSAGAASPWHPYLQVLPQVVPSPHTTFSWEDIQEIQYGPMLRDYDHAAWVASSAQARLSGEATGGGAREELEWALSVVHSRSFGSPGEGGTAVRMLVPVIDLLNHAGDEYYPGAGPLMGATARDNVRWDVEAPEGPEGEWCMKVSATRDIEAGEELLLSYGERSNDSFFQHYGFIPPRNPHDDVTLFDNIEEAVQWMSQALAGQVAAAAPEAAAPGGAANPIAAALEAASRHAPNLGPQPSPTSEAESEIMAREAARVKLLAGARLDSRLMAAFDVLSACWDGRNSGGSGSGGSSSGDEGTALGGAGSLSDAESMAARQRRFHSLVALRCRELLGGMGTSLLDDLEALAAWEEASSGSVPESVQHGFAAMLQQYRSDIEAYCAQEGTALADPFGSGTAAAAAEGVLSSALVDAGAAAVDAGGEQLLSLLRELAAAGPPAGAAVEDAPADSSAAGTAVGKEQQRQEQQEQQQQPSMLPVVYRVYKKQILWDAILAAAASD